MENYLPFVLDDTVSTVIVTVRDPDAANLFYAWVREGKQGRAFVVDIDLGATDIDGDPDSRADFNEYVTTQATMLKNAGWDEAADAVLEYKIAQGG